MMNLIGDDCMMMIWRNKHEMEFVNALDIIKTFRETNISARVEFTTKLHMYEPNEEQIIAKYMIEDINKIPNGYG